MISTEEYLLTYVKRPLDSETHNWYSSNTGYIFSLEAPFVSVIMGPHGNMNC